MFFAIEVEAVDEMVRQPGRTGGERAAGRREFALQREFTVTAGPSDRSGGAEQNAAAYPKPKNAPDHNNVTHCDLDRRFWQPQLVL